MQSGAGAIIDRAYDFTGSFGIGLDFTGGAFSTSPIVLAAGQKICLESSCSYTISDQAGVIYISTPSGNVISMSAAGAISATSTVNASGYSVSGTAGFTGTKTAGSCVFTINGGIITNVTGC